MQSKDRSHRSNQNDGDATITSYTEESEDGKADAVFFQFHVIRMNNFVSFVCETVAAIEPQHQIYAFASFRTTRRSTRICYSFLVNTLTSSE